MLASRSTVVKANARPVAQRALRPSCRVAVVNARHNPAPAASSGDSLFRATMAAGFAAAVLLLNNQPATASIIAPGVTTGNDSPQESILGRVDKVDEKVRRQPTEAVTKGNENARDKVLDQVQNLKGDIKEQTQGLDWNKDKDQSPFLKQLDRQAPMLKATDMRKDVSNQVVDTANDLKGRVVDTSNDLKSKGNDLKSQVVDKANEAKGQVTGKASEIKGQVVDKTNEAKGQVTDKASDLKSRAVDNAKILQKNLSSDQPSSESLDLFKDKMTAKPLDALTGTTSAKEASTGSKVLGDLEKLDDAVRKQPTGAVKQAAQDLKEEIVDQAKDFQDNLSSTQSPLGIQDKSKTAGKADRQAGEGLQANLAQLKSLLGL